MKALVKVVVMPNQSDLFGDNNQKVSFYFVDAITGQKEQPNTVDRAYYERAVNARICHYTAQRITAFLQSRAAAFRFGDSGSTEQRCKSMDVLRSFSEYLYTFSDWRKQAAYIHQNCLYHLQVLQPSVNSRFKNLRSMVDFIDANFADTVNT